MVELYGFLLSLITTAFATYFGGFCGGIGDIWKPALMLVGLTLLYILLFFVALLIISYCINQKKPAKTQNKLCLYIFKIVLAFIMRWSGAKVIVRGREKVPDGTALWIMNHRSNFDPMVLYNEFRFKNMIMVSKPGNFKIPILGGFIHKMAYMSINRENDREALKTILQAIARIKEGYSITIFPEGTRNKTDEELLPFKSGVFKIAMKANVPIVVTTVYGGENIHKNFPFKRTKIYLDIVGVITPEDYKGIQTHEVADLAVSMMLPKIQEYKREYNKGKI